MTKETLYSSYRIVEKYRRLTETNIERTLPAPMFSALDAFVMRHIAAFYPQPPTVIDLAAKITNGASTIFWLDTVPHIRQVVVPAEQAGNWFGNWTNAVELLEINPNQQKAFTLLDSSLSASAKSYPFQSPTIVMLIVQELATVHLEEISRQYPDALLLLLPLGQTNGTGFLHTGLRFCSTTALDYRLLPIRDISPFFFASDMGLIYPQSHIHVPDIINRLRTLYEGNLDFLTLIETNFRLQSKVKQLENTVKQHNSMLAETIDSKKSAIDPRLKAPPPTFTGRILLTTYRGMVPPRLRLSLHHQSQRSLSLPRQMYHALIPISVRLKLRNLRVRLFGG